jgi:hypothetical protein
MGYAERTVSALIAVACIVMLVRLAMGAHRQQKLDRTIRDAWASVQKTFTRLYRRQATKKQAEKATQEILQRMRQPVERSGNVITPKAFKRPGSADRQDDLH